MEVLHHGEWGTVCHHNWNLQNSDVVCKQLGHDKAIETFTPGDDYDEGPIMLTDVVCNEMDDYLSDCRHDGWFIHMCDHSMDVGVECDRGKNKSSPKFRIFDTQILLRCRTTVSF